MRCNKQKKIKNIIPKIIQARKSCFDRWHVLKRAIWRALNPLHRTLCHWWDSARSSLLMDRSVITRVIIRAATIRYVNDALSRSMDIEMQIGLLIDRLDLWPASDLKSLRWARVWFMCNVVASWLCKSLERCVVRFHSVLFALQMRIKGRCLQHACLIWGNEPPTIPQVFQFSSFSTVYDTVSYCWEVRRNFKVFQVLIRIPSLLRGMYRHKSTAAYFSCFSLWLMNARWISSSNNCNFKFWN